MSIGLQPLIWKNVEKGDKDDVWPKRCFGASLLYLEDLNKYILIGGNHDAYQNHKNNFYHNRQLINSPIENFNKVEQAKLNYIEQNVNANYYTDAQIDTYFYELTPEPHWYRVVGSGKYPKPRSNHKCIYITPFIFLYGGVELGPKSENGSNEDMYVFNTRTYKWKIIESNLSPFNRTEFQWIKIEERAFLYGGCSSPSENLYNDMWMFKYDNSDLSYTKSFENEVKNEIIKDDIWFEIEQQGELPGKIKAYGMEYNDGYLYLFGGIDIKGNHKNTGYRFQLRNGSWEIVETKGTPPQPRCYNEMALINHETLGLYGGITGNLENISMIFNDVFLFNIKELIWVQPIIGGIEPSPYFGVSLCCNYSHEKMEITIGGGSGKENDNMDKSKFFVRIFSITEKDPLSNYYWTIRDVKYKEQQNDENFLLQAEESIYEYKEKISNLELDTRAKELANEDMKKQIDDFKKEFYQLNGFIDDQSQSLEEQINEQETQKNKMLENYEMDKEITDLKIKLKFVMEKKTDKTLEFFNETCSIFMTYYDALSKVMNCDHNGEGKNAVPIEDIKDKYTEKLKTLKSKFEKFNTTEEGIVAELHRGKHFEKSLEDAFKTEIQKYKLEDES